MEHDKFMLVYFSGGKQEKEINDAYWDKLNKVFWDCHVLIDSMVPKV
jgi:hypothetical protein